MAAGQQTQVGHGAGALAPARQARGARPLRARRRADWTLAVPPAVTLIVMLWGMATPSYWRDESATLAATDRSIPQLLRLLGRVDAVHGLYYLILWPVVHFVGTREFETRLPSTIAMAAAALGIAAIGRRLRSRPAGLYAGLVFAAMPLVTLQGHDARPYALETAAVTANLARPPGYRMIVSLSLCLPGCFRWRIMTIGGLQQGALAGHVGRARVGPAFCPARATAPGGGRCQPRREAPAASRRVVRAGVHLGALVVGGRRVGCLRRDQPAGDAAAARVADRPVPRHLGEPDGDLRLPAVADPADDTDAGRGHDRHRRHHRRPGAQGPAGRRLPGGSPADRADVPGHGLARAPAAGGHRGTGGRDGGGAAGLPGEPAPAQAAAPVPAGRLPRT